MNGKTYEKFHELQSKILKTWIYKDFRIVLEKDTLDIWVNGSKVEVVVSIFNLEINPGKRVTICFQSVTSKPTILLV